MAQEGSLFGPLYSKLFLAVCANFVLILFGTSAITPFISLYSVSLGSSLAAVGISVASLSLAAVLVDGPAGILVESLGTRKMMVLGAIASLTGGLLGATIPVMLALLVSVFLVGAGQAMIMISNWTMVGELAPAGKRGLYTTYYLLLTTIGIVVGPIAGGIVVDRFGLSAPFYLQSAAAGASLIITLAAIRSVGKTNPSRPSFHEIKQVVLSMILRREIVLVNLGWLVNGIITIGVINTAFPLHSKLQLGLTATQIGAAISISRGSGLVSYVVTGHIYDRYKGKWPYVLGFLIVAISMIALGGASDFSQVLIILAVFGFASSLISSSQILFGVDTPTNSRRAMWIGIYRVFGDLGQLFGPLIVATMIGALGFAEMFEIVFLIGFSYSILLALGLQTKQKVEPS